jgi:hypothetical protein
LTFSITEKEGGKEDGKRWEKGEKESKMRKMEKGKRENLKEEKARK